MAAMLVLVLLALGCSQPVEVTFRLPSDGALVVTRNAKSVTRTPMGPESLEMKSTKRFDVLSGGEAGVDELHWREEYTRYELTYESKEYELEWKLGLNEDGEQEPIPAPIAVFGPHPPREVWVTPDHQIKVRWLPWPEPETEEEVEAPPPPAEEPEEPVEPEPPPPPVEVSLEEVDNWLSGLILAPKEPVKPGQTWSWTISQKVTRGGQVSNTSTWRFDRVAGKELVLVETLTMSSAMAPASGQFRTTALSGSGEMRLDTTTGLPTTYTSAYEASLASPSAIGSSTMKVDAKFKWKGP